MRRLRMRTEPPVRTSDTEHASTPEPPTPTGDVNDPAQLRAAADRVRTWIADTTAQADALRTQARAEADRLLADAEDRARDLTAGHRRGQSLIRDLEECAGYLDHAAAQRARAAVADQQATDLATEAAALTADTEALARRLADLGAQRETIAAGLAASRDAGDVAAVAASRTEMAAVDDVIAALGARREAIAARLQAIGEPGGRGELPDAQARADAARAEVRRIENLLDPDRPEAQADHLVDLLNGYLDHATAREGA